MIFTDTHSHLYLSDFDNDRYESVERALQSGVRRLFLPNIDNSTLPSLLAVCDAFPTHCFPMIGLHPGSVNTDYRKTLEGLEEMLGQRSFVGIGETGIDLYWDKKFRKEQIHAFTLQAKLARKHQLPLVIHVRHAFDEVFSVLDKLHSKDLKGIFHCFTGTETEAEKAIGYSGFKLGIGGIVTFKNAGLAEVVKGLSLNDLVLETDAPYLAPAPHRGKRNESAYLPYIAEYVSQLSGESIETVAEVTTQNSLELFGI